MTNAKKIKELEIAIDRKADEITVFEIGKDLENYFDKETEMEHKRLMKEFNALIDQLEELKPLAVGNEGAVMPYFRYYVQS